MNIKTLRKYLCRTTSFSVAALVSLQFANLTSANAAEFVIDTPVTVQNGGNVVNGNDTLTVR